MTALRWLLIPLAVAASHPALADTSTAQSSFGVRLVVTSQCTTQYSLFGPQALSPVSVICSPGSTPFMTFSSIVNGVAIGNTQPNSPNGPDDAGQNSKRDPEKPEQPPFAVNASQFSPLASKSTAISGQKTRIVHVTF